MDGATTSHSPSSQTHRSPSPRIASKYHHTTPSRTREEKEDGSMTIISSKESTKGATGFIHQPSAFVKFWLLVSSIIVIWDFSFIFLRRWSLTSQGGALAALWPGYDLYEFVDLNYSAKYWLENRGFPLAQSTLNVIEDLLNFSYLYLVHKSDPAYRAIAPIVGFSGVLMTFSKTLLYFLCDYYCGWCESGHNDSTTWVFLYLLPNGFWIICPAYLTFYFGREIAALLTAAAGISDSPFALEEVKAAARMKKST